MQYFENLEFRRNSWFREDYYSISIREHKVQKSAETQCHDFSVCESRFRAFSVLESQYR